MLKNAIARSFNTNVELRADAVVYPETVAEVVAAVGYARERGLRVAPQATGHNVAPHGSLDGTVLVDMSRFQQIAIDPVAQLVRVGAGVKWERVAPLLSDHGLAGLHGSSPDVGIAGYSLGGGMGWLARRHGLQANSVTALEVVLADGRHVRVDPDNEPDLFWALRGGNGNFGVVTAIEFRVYPVEELYAGAMFFPFERTAEVLHTWRRILPGAPDELMTWASIIDFPPLPFVPEDLQGRKYVIVMGAHLGSESEGRDLLRPVRDLGPEIDTYAMVPPAALGDLAMDPPDPLPFESTHVMLGDSSAGAIDAIIEAVGPDSGAPLGLVQLRHMGGALARVAPGAGARATLPGEIAVFALGVTPDAASHAALEAALDELQRVAKPYAAGWYPNFVEEPAGDVSRFFDAATWERLRAVKAAYDPADLFRGNHRVPPAATQARLAA
jgi:FAD/FMN-containing dehydrogenase